MATTRTTSTPGARRRTPGILTAAALLALASLAVIAVAPGAPTATAGGSAVMASAYSWPVKPFGRPHPVRANFGDPRTTFHGPPTQAGVLTSRGSFSFHFGVDIAVPDGTAVYPVRSGTASLLGGRNVQVDSGAGFKTQYWHIIPAVKQGQQVTAQQTVLGHVMKGYEHVHFTELRNGRPVNPLAPGHLGPYDEETAPQLGTISFRVGNTAREALVESVTGAVVPVVRAQDLPARRVPGLWADLPVAPALLTWHVERAANGRIAVPRRVAFDVRTSIPENSAFWTYYARGSRQNMATFGTQRAWRTPGTYLYRLSRKPFDTRKLRNGVYRLVVTATDIRGNSSSLAQIFVVRNGLGT
ncbi:MAG: M23 family metallopeptidase [Gaiellaceae bacterium]